jgi:hypothetical protein
MRIRLALPLILMLASGPAYAHKLVIKRTLMLEPSGAHDLQILVMLEVPSGPPRKALAELADANHDGSIDAGEERHMRQLLAVRALDGIRIVAGTSTLAIDNVETKLKIGRSDAPVVLAVHGVAALPGLTLSITTALEGDPLDLEVLPGNRPVSWTERGTIKGGGFKASLGLGDRARFGLVEARSGGYLERNADEHPSRDTERSSEPGAQPRHPRP